MSFKEIYMFNLQESVFGIDLNILLDWVDPKLLRGTHYFYNVETRCFEFTRQYLKAVQNDTSVLFDPKVKLENMFTRLRGTTLSRANCEWWRSFSKTEKRTCPGCPRRCPSGAC